MRRRQILTLLAVVLLCLCVYSISRVLPRSAGAGQNAAKTTDTPKEPVIWKEPSIRKGGIKPKRMEDTTRHPIWSLLEEEQANFEAVKTRQSTTLAQAVAEYRRRYNIHPPPHFDKWFEFAQKNNVQLLDEYNTINELVTPFWGLKPSTIRSRAKEALGCDNGFIGVAIRKHAVTSVHNGDEWQQETFRKMMKKFLKYLPDMDLVFNIHDEPRVMVPHDDMAKLVDKARNENMPKLSENQEPTNDFSSTSPELGNGLTFEKFTYSRFNEFPHQATWTHSRMSCPPDSPARRLDEDERLDDLSQYAVTDLGFVYNHTALSDICLTPSLQSTFGFFDRPNAYILVQDLFPIFSASKINTYADLIYPSPWYWWGLSPYQQRKDTSWTKKANKLYWRGSTTGGFSRDGGWMRQHRQRFVKKINDHDNAKTYANVGSEESPAWEANQSPREDLKSVIDVHFSHVGQCDPIDCEAQADFFGVVKHVELYDAYASKYLLDMDGNAFSGRFYAFLQSRSQVYKMSIFKEWHEERIKPWVHYVPLSLQGDDWLEAVRFFDDSKQSKNEAEKMAMASREWSKKTVRRVDMEAWIFRLLLEYARVIDENRDILGYNPTSASKKLNVVQRENTKEVPLGV